MVEVPNILGNTPANGEIEIPASTLLELSKRGGINKDGTLNQGMLQQLLAANQPAPATQAYDPMGLFSQFTAPAQAAPAQPIITPAPAPAQPEAQAPAPVQAPTAAAAPQAAAPEQPGAFADIFAKPQNQLNPQALYAASPYGNVMNFAQGLHQQPFVTQNTQVVDPLGVMQSLNSAPITSTTAEKTTMAEPTTPPASTPQPAQAPAPAAAAAAPAPAKLAHSADFKFDENNAEHVNGLKAMLNEYFGDKRKPLELNGKWDDATKDAMKQAKIETYNDGSLNAGYLENTLKFSKDELQKLGVLGADGKPNKDYDRNAPSEAVVKAVQEKLKLEQSGKYDDSLIAAVKKDKADRYIDGRVTNDALTALEDGIIASKQASVQQGVENKGTGAGADAGDAEEKDDKKLPGFLGNNKGGLLMGALAVAAMAFSGGTNLIMMLLVGLAAFAGGNMLIDKDTSLVSGLLGNSPQKKADFEKGLAEGKGVEGVFVALDKDKDGKVNVQADKLDLPESITSQLDPKGLSQEEFKKLLASNEGLRKAIVDVADKNKDGQIARPEINSLGDAPPAPPAATPAAPAATAQAPGTGR